MIVEEITKLLTRLHEEFPTEKIEGAISAPRHNIVLDEEGQLRLDVFQHGLWFHFIMCELIMSDIEYELSIMKAYIDDVLCMRKYGILND